MNGVTEAGAAAAAVVGIDVGGTFTDFVAATGSGLLVHKEPSTPEDPSLAVERGLRVLIARGARLDGSGALLVHGTTIALNALLQRRGARIALIVGEGTRDVLEIARCRMPSSYDFRAGKPEPMVPRDRVLKVPARMAADGTVLRRPATAELDALAAAVTASGAEAAAIMLLHAYVDPSLERAVAEALAMRLPGFPVTCSGEVWPEIREYERTVIACVNAQVQPLMERYLGRLRERLEAAGAGAATLQLTSSAGGVVSLRSGLARPVETLFSGPASGVMAAAKLAGRLGMASAVTFDMGGTSADVALLQDGAPAQTTQAAIGDLPIMLPVVGVSSVGAGGGSIVSVDAVGVIKVGPESAGSRPGPVAYGLGGTRPTITDCYVATGILDPEGFLGGRMRLDRAAAEAALAPLAERLGLPGPAAAAEAALRVATVQMATYLFKLLARSGTDPARLGLVPYGGAGPTQANLLAEEAGLDAVVVPPYAATFCALGAILADIRRDFVRSLPRGGRATPDAPFAAWAALEAEAAEWIAGEGARIAGRHTEYAADMRYSGQSHDMVVRIPAEARRAGDPAMVAEAFHREHERLYGFREADEAVEVTTVRLSVLGQVPAVDIPERPPRPPEPPPDRRRQVYLSGAWRDVPVRVARHLAVGEAVRGPLLVEAPDTTLLVLPGWQATAGQYGEIAIRREAADHAA